MKIKPLQVAAAAALVGLLGIGGMQLASAQEDDTSTTTETPSATEDSVPDDSSGATEAPSATDREPCDHGDRGGAPGGGPGGGEADTDSESDVDASSL